MGDGFKCDRPTIVGRAAEKKDRVVQIGHTNGSAFQQECLPVEQPRLVSRWSRAFRALRDQTSVLRLTAPELLHRNPRLPVRLQRLLGRYGIHRSVPGNQRTPRVKGGSTGCSERPKSCDSLTWQNLMHSPGDRSSRSNRCPHPCQHVSPEKKRCHRMLAVGLSDPPLLVLPRIGPHWR